MAILVLSQPEAVFPAFSRARLALTPTGEETEVTLTVTAFDFSHVSSFTREFFLENDDIGPEATFDLGEIARQLFFDGLDEINEAENSAQGCTAAYVDCRLGVRFSVAVTGGPTSTFLAVNAAAMPGGSALVWEGYVGGGIPYKILTSMPALLFYSGFTDTSFVQCLIPASASGANAIFAVISGGTTFFTSSALGDGAGKVVAVKIPSANGDFPITLDDDGLFVLDPDLTGLYLDIEMRCLPDAPFYIRWINRLGGRDHWMFGRRSVLQEQTDDEVFYEPFYDLNERAGQGQHVISLSSERVVTVGDEGIETSYFTPLKDVITSPLVEYYDDEVGKWLTVRVKDGRTTFNREDNLHGIELKLILPARDLQF